MSGETVWHQTLALGWVDLAMLALLALSVAVGLWRGVVFELMSLLGWVVAYVVAKWYSPEVAPHVPIGSAGSALNTAVAFAVVFIAALLVWGLFARLMRLLISATPLSVVDRLMGAVFGLLRGGVVLLVLGSVVGMTPAARSRDWQASHGAQRLSQALDGIRQAWPEDWGRHLRQQVGL